MRIPRHDDVASSSGGRPAQIGIVALVPAAVPAAVVPAGIEAEYRIGGSVVVVFAIVVASSPVDPIPPPPTGWREYPPGHVRSGARRPRVDLLGLRRRSHFPRGTVDIDVDHRHRPAGGGILDVDVDGRSAIRHRRLRSPIYISVMDGRFFIFFCLLLPILPFFCAGGAG